MRRARKQVSSSQEIPGGYDAPSQYRIEYTYANGVTQTTESTLRNRFDGSVAEDQAAALPEHGVKFEGSDGWIFVTRGTIKASRQELLDEPLTSRTVELCVSNNHMGNHWLPRIRFASRRRSGNGPRPVRTFLLLQAVTFALATARTMAGVADFKITTDRTIDTSSLESIVRQVIARSAAKTNDEKAIAIFDWLHGTIFHAACPTEKRPQSVGPLKSLNVYGWGLCGSEHTILKALFETAGWPCRYVGWSDPGHSMIEVSYDGKWHYLDVFLKTYFWTKDRSHLASQDEIAADPSIVLDAVKDGRAARQHLACGDTPEDLLRGIKSRKVIGDEKGWGNLTWRDEGYSTALAMPTGATLRLDWKNMPDAFAVNGKAPQHSCGIKDFRNDAVLGPLLEHYGPRNWSNGQLIFAPDFARAADVAAIVLSDAKAGGGKIAATGERGVAVFKLPLPYAYVSAKAEAVFENGAGHLSVSSDGGKSWTAAPGNDISALVKQKYDVWLKAEFAGSLAKIAVEAVVEHNRSAQPYLLPGRNVVTVAAGKLTPNEVVAVTYTFQEATVADPAKRNRWDGQGIRYSEPKTVRKELEASPSQFEIEVGGNTPPKMLGMTREVIGKR